MRQFQHKILHEGGLHARVAVSLAGMCRDYESRVSVQKGGMAGDGRDVFSMMNLKAARGEVLTFLIEGADEAEVEEQLCRWCGTFL
ncbi:HPr family phosphocarrier protein [Lachnospiraceae bacterium 54-53]